MLSQPVNYYTTAPSCVACVEPVFEQLKKAGLFKKSDQCIVYVGVHDAVLAAVGSHSALYQQVFPTSFTAIYNCK